jgi:CHAT domain-containing protein/WD40 domain-containing protein
VTNQDFRVEIGAGGPKSYEIVLRAPDGGEASVTMRLPLTEKRLAELAARVPDAVLMSSAGYAGPPDVDQPVRQLGTLLFDALFGETGRGILTASRNQAAAEGQLLRLVLQIRPAELARLPWEFMFDSHEEQYVGLSAPMIRYPQVLKPVKPMRVNPPLRILGMVARPSDQGQLATDEEVVRLEGALSELVRDGLIELGWVAGQTWRDLRDAVWDGPWHVFHFIGHGGVDPAGNDGSLALATDDGGTYYLGADDAAWLLGEHYPLRLVVLNACDTDRAGLAGPFSGLARTLIRRGTPAVLAMQNEITDRAALEFSRTFYTALAGLQPVDVAAMHARQAVRLGLPGSLEWGTPVLYMRSGDGRLFDPADALTGSFRQVPAGAAATAQQAPLQPAALEPAPLQAAPLQAAPLEPALAQQAQALLAPPAIEPAEVATLRTPDQVNAVAFSADGRLIALACDGRLALVVDEIGRECLRIRHDAAVPAVRDIRIDPAGGRVATAAERSARIWATADGGLLLKVSHGDTVRGLSFSPDGQLLATGSADKTARIWDAATGERLAELPHPGSVLAVAFSPDGRLLATACGAGSAWLWTTAGGGQVHQVHHDGSVRAVAFSADGRLFATGGTDATARLWDAATGEGLATMRHEGPVRALAFSPDGQLLATGGTDATTRLWDAATGESLATIRHEGPVRALAFSPDGQLLATGSQGRMVKLWRPRGTVTD